MTEQITIEDAGLPIVTDDPVAQRMYELRAFAPRQADHEYWETARKLIAQESDSALLDDLIEAVWRRHGKGYMPAERDEALRLAFAALRTPAGSD